jgi:hypothetical protein
MKRGLEEMSAETSNSKKAKTISNGGGSVEIHKTDGEGEQWIQVEKKKKKKKKISKAESKVDVCIIFLW